MSYIYICIYIYIYIYIHIRTYDYNDYHKSESEIGNCYTIIVSYYQICWDNPPDWPDQTPIILWWPLRVWSRSVGLQLHPTEPRLEPQRYIRSPTLETWKIEGKHHRTTILEVENSELIRKGNSSSDCRTHFSDLTFRKLGILHDLTSKMPSLAACFPGMSTAGPHTNPIPQSEVPLGLTMNKYSTFRVPEWSRPMKWFPYVPNIIYPTSRGHFGLHPSSCHLLISRFLALRLESKTPTTKGPACVAGRITWAAALSPNHTLKFQHGTWKTKAPKIIFIVR